MNSIKPKRFPVLVTRIISELGGEKVHNLPLKTYVYSLLLCFIVFINLTRVVV